MTIEELVGLIADRIKLADADPESGHASIDGLIETVLEEAAKGEDVQQKAALVMELLAREEAEGWRRWYA